MGKLRSLLSAPRHAEDLAARTERRPLAPPLLVPLHPGPEPTLSFNGRFVRARERLGPRARWLPPQPADRPLPPAAEAAFVPEVDLGVLEAAEHLGASGLPAMVATSADIALEPWDLEVRDTLRRRGVRVIAPLDGEEAETACRALALRSRLRHGLLVTWADEPERPRRFAWWDAPAVDLLRDRFGVRVERRSLDALRSRAEAVDERRALAHAPPGLPPDLALDAARLHLALRDELDELGDDVLAGGIDCLAPSAHAGATPCHAWARLFEERGILWGCEADLLSMATELLVHHVLDTPVVMTNVYPFLLGQQVLDHLRLSRFPDVDRPRDHVLAAHCGYLGVLPVAHATGPWELRPAVIAMAGPKGHAIDAELPVGTVTIAKLSTTSDALMTTSAELTGYAGEPESDCRNGAVLRVADGDRFTDRLPSHHVVLASGDGRRGLEIAGQAFGLPIEPLC